jgi:hypothetical protein
VSPEPVGRKNGDVVAALLDVHVPVARADPKGERSRRRGPQPALDDEAVAGIRQAGKMPRENRLQLQVDRVGRVGRGLDRVRARLEGREREAELP